MAPEIIDMHDKLLSNLKHQLGSPYIIKGNKSEINLKLNINQDLLSKIPSAIIAVGGDLTSYRNGRIGIEFLVNIKIADLLTSGGKRGLKVDFSFSGRGCVDMAMENNCHRSLPHVSAEISKLIQSSMI